MDAPVYSERLGAIRDAQFDAALCKSGLGQFISATAVEGGLFGQNVFLRASSGDYVFRGAPHWLDGRRNDAWQFPKERWFADLIHARTSVPVAWPQILDDTCEDFPWPYLLAPRLPGLCLANQSSRLDLERQDFQDIAWAMGETLANLHTLAWPFAGDFDPKTQLAAPYVGGYTGHLTVEIDRFARAARANGALDLADRAWLATVVAADPAAEPLQPTFVHNDYTPGNVLLARAAKGWRVSGVVDLMTCCFGDPAADLVRHTCQLFDIAPRCAEAFLGGYRRAGGVATPSDARLATLAAHERLMIWEYFTRPGHLDDRLQGLTFRAWAEP